MTETVVSLPISGMTCAACAARLEKVLGKLDGVSASVSFASEQAQIRYLPERISPQQLLDSIGKAGFSVPQQALELDITGMTCAACAVRLEKVLNKLPAVQAQVNFANQTARLHFAVGLLQVPDAMAAISKAGFQGRQRQATQAQDWRQQQASQYRRELYWFTASALLTLPFLLEMLAMLFGWHGLMLPRGLQLALATPVQFIIGWRFYRGAWHALRSGGANMDVLVALGTSMAWLLSTVVTLLGWQ